MAACKAHNREGKPCRKPAIKGGNVCMTHGGATPQVRRAAALRLMALVDPAISVLGSDLKDKRHPEVRQRAARDILDRAGIASAQQIVIETADGSCFAATLATLTDEELELASRIADKLAQQSGSSEG